MPQVKQETKDILIEAGYALWKGCEFTDWSGLRRALRDVLLDKRPEITDLEDFLYREE